MQPAEKTDPDGVDYGWVMQTTFVVTIVLGAPIVALLSITATLPTWSARAGFAVSVGAPIWFTTAVSLFVYAKRRAPSSDDTDGSEDHGQDTGPTN